jgi:putative transposase
MNNITQLCRWFCSKLTEDELFSSICILLDVYYGRKSDFKLRPKEDLPNYHQYHVDEDLPLLERPAPILNWKELLKETAVKPIKSRGGGRPSKHLRCQHCDAPSPYLYLNGRKSTQALCKVCHGSTPTNRQRCKNDTPYFCPHCNGRLGTWKRSKDTTIYKCFSYKCPYYLSNLANLNQEERALQKTGKSSQFKLHYQFRDYHFEPHSMRVGKPDGVPVNLAAIKNNRQTLGLVLSYAVSVGLSARATSQVMEKIHGIQISHQTVINYINSAAVNAWNFFHKHRPPLEDDMLCGDETYVRTCGSWHYTWLLLGDKSKAIHAFNTSDNRNMTSALATFNMLLENVPEGQQVEFVADGNPSYDAAVQMLNFAALNNNKTLPLKRHKVIGLQNLDKESTKYRRYKQIIERLNRTYKYHTRPRAGFKSFKGYNCLTVLFVAFYNYIRPHSSCRGEPPVPIPELEAVTTWPGQWLKLLQMSI